jgi:hypothetical protein
MDWAAAAGTGPQMTIATTVAAALGQRLMPRGVGSEPDSEWPTRRILTA